MSLAHFRGKPMQKIAGILIASFAALPSISATAAYGHGGGGKWRTMDCATLAIQENNVTGGKLPSKDIKHREKIKRIMQKRGCTGGLG